MVPQPPAPGAPGEWAGAGYKRRPAVGSGGCLWRPTDHDQSPPSCVHVGGPGLGDIGMFSPFRSALPRTSSCPEDGLFGKTKTSTRARRKRDREREVLLQALSMSAAGCMGPASSSITPMTPRELRRFPPGFSPAWVLGGETGIRGSGEQVFLSLNGGRGGRCVCQEPART